jgi:Cd2+/Zn2+-exporting ATPase
MQPSRSAATTTSAYCVDGLCCAEEESLIRKKLTSLDGIQELHFNLVTRTLTVAHTCSGDAIVLALKSAGFASRPAHLPPPEEPFLVRNRLLIETLTGGALLATGIILNIVTPGGTAAHLLFLLATALTGWRVAWKALRSLGMLQLDMNILMTVAAISAIAIGREEEGAAVMVLFSVSLLLEAMSTARSRRSLHALINLSPAEASVIRAGAEHVVDVRTVRPGEQILIRPGERIPLDGRVSSGISSVDQSPITGESLPVAKQSGDVVFAGSINGMGSMQVEVIRAHDATALAGIVRMVNAAIDSRAPIQRTVDTFARYYTPAVFCAALLVASLPPLLFGLPFSEWFYKSLILLVIACPCALVISTPVTIVNAISAAARRGVLVKGGERLEALSGIRAMAFDKTGTLTEGRPVVTDIIAFDPISSDQLLAITAAIEWRSEHPLAAAVIAKAREEGVQFENPHPESFESLPGKGLRARINEKEYFVGNHALVEEMGRCSPGLEALLRRLESDSKTSIVVGDSASILGVVAVADRMRSQAAPAMHELRAAGIRKLILITGDNQEVAGRIGAELGLDEVHAEVFPGGKVREVASLQQQHGSIAMVGDGINDAPALATAAIGIAMGAGGTDVAAETADIVLMSDDLLKIPYLIRLSRKAIGIIRQNIAIALTTKLLFIVLGLLGVSSLWMAVFADDGATLLVILNGLRLFNGAGEETSGRSFS